MNSFINLETLQILFHITKFFRTLRAFWNKMEGKYPARLLVPCLCETWKLLQLPHCCWSYQHAHLEHVSAKTSQPKSKSEVHTGNELAGNICYNPRE